jgi:hypothetical protein
MKFAVAHAADTIVALDYRVFFQGALDCRSIVKLSHCSYWSRS